jgi:hypothetical protein
MRTMVLSRKDPVTALSIRPGIKLLKMTKKPGLTIILARNGREVQNRKKRRRSQLQAMKLTKGTMQLQTRPRSPVHETQLGIPQIQLRSQRMSHWHALSR